MKSISLFIGLLLSCFGLSAQSDYALFPKDSVIYASEHYEFPNFQISLDTVDTVVYQELHPTYHQTLNSPFSDEGNCLSMGFGHFDWYNSHWLGADLQYDNNGVYSFVNQLGESFVIPSKAPVDSSWVFVDFYYDEYVVGTVDSISFNGNSLINDSVKYISFQRLNEDGEVVPDFINELEIQIGISKGLIKSPSFLNYTSLCYDMEYEFEVFDYKEVLDEIIPIEKSNRYKVWNLEIGDEYHTSKIYADLTPNKQQITILEKGWLADLGRFIYKKHIKSGKWVGFYENGDYIHEYQISESTIYDTIYLDEYLFLDSALTGIDIDGVTRAFSKSYFYDDFFFVGKQLNNFVIDSADQWSENQMTTYGILDHYVEGVGGPFYSYGNDMGFYEKKALVYISKANYTFGEPHNLSLNEPSFHPIKVYPNPASDKITIQLDYVTNGQIQLLDIAGKLVFEKSIKEGSMLQELNVANQFPGIYFIRILNNGVEVKTEKIIIQ